MYKNNRKDISSLNEETNMGLDSLMSGIERKAISSAVYGTPLDMSDTALKYVHSQAQDEGEQLKDALDKARQSD
jgi:hypothetical protein